MILFLYNIKELNFTKVFGEYISKDFFSGGIYMHKRFVIETIIENGHGHYKVTDNISGNIIHCEFNELNDTIYELLGWR